jgi:hypothetical protein
VDGCVMSLCTEIVYMFVRTTREEVKIIVIFFNVGYKLCSEEMFNE